MKFSDSDNQPNGLNIIQKIGVCILVITIVAYYILSIQFLAGLD